MSFPYDTPSPAPPRFRRGGPPLRQDRVVLVLFGVGLLVTVGFALGIALGVRGDDITILALAMLTFYLACIPLSVDQGRLPAYRHIFMSLLAVVFILYYVIPALVIFIPAERPIDVAGLGLSAVTDPDVIDGQMVVLVGLITLLVTYALPLGRNLGARLPVPVWEWPPRVALIAGTGMVGLGWSITVGSVLGLIPRELGTGVIGTLGVAETYANVLLTYLAVRYRMRAAIVVVVLNCVAGGAIGLLTSGKERALIGPAMVALTWIIMTRRIRARWVLGGILAIVLIYPVSGFIRGARSQGVPMMQLIGSPFKTLGMVATFVGNASPAEYFGDGLSSTAIRTDGLGVTSVLVRDTPSRSPFQNGSTVALFFVSFVPRALWPGKPNIQLGKWIASTYGAGKSIEEASYIAPTQIGEWYINFGVWGVMLGMFLIGLIVRICQESLLQGRGTAASMLVTSVFLYLLTRKFQGSVAGAYSEIVFTITPILLTHFAFRFAGIAYRIDPGAGEIGPSRSAPLQGAPGPEPRFRTT
jgi:hypothetical protein